MGREIRNKQNQLARECITSALIQLVREKPLSAVSVKELTARAGVSRMTFCFFLYCACFFCFAARPPPPPPARPPPPPPGPGYPE